MIKPNKSSSLAITAENEDEFVITRECNKCPDDSGCYQGIKHSSGASICMCYHYNPPTPLKKGEKCKRKVSKIFPTDNIDDHLHNHSVIPVHLDHKPAHDVPGEKNTRQEFFFTTVTLSIVLISFIVSVSFLLYCLIKRQKLKKLFSNRSKQKVEMLDLAPSSSVLLLPTDRFVANPTYDSATTCVDLSIRVFSPTEVKLFSQIGQGCFGKVFKGELEGGEVAVKVVKKEYASESMKEVETMAAFSHSNILQLIGIVRGEEADIPWLIFEFMKYGDLASVLRKNDRGRYAACTTNESRLDKESAEDELQLTQESLFDIAKQIAEGMKYLASQHFVHRDLAARNCLVSATGAIKISDFGLSRDVYTCDYYKMGGSRLLPLRWMAPESILYGRFTLESDVWAFGILMWEVFTWGKQPYYGHSNDEVVQLILDGVLLCPPSDCPTSISKIMEGCWKTEPRDRLKFHQIAEKLADKIEHKDQQDSHRGTCTIPQSSIKRPSASAIQSWLESGYEVPRNILQTEYLKVV